MNETETIQWELAGKVAISTGSIMICDPMEKNKFEDEDVWDGVWNSNRKYTSLVTEKNDRMIPLAFASMTGHGDGLYPVFVRRGEDGTIHEIRIQFTDNCTQLFDNE